MACHAPLITFEPVTLDKIARAHLFKSEHFTALDWWRVKSDHAARLVQVSGIFANGHRVGTAVWSVDSNGEGKTVYMEEIGANPFGGANIARAAFLMLRDVAVSIGARAVRCETTRRGLVRILKDRATSITQRENGAGQVQYVLEGI